MTDLRLEELCMQDMVDVVAALAGWEKKFREAGLLADSNRMKVLRERFEKCDSAYLETGDRPF